MPYDNSLNRLIICLDSIRYDQFLKANTPNIDKLGIVEERYSPGCITLISILAYLHNFAPIKIDLSYNHNFNIYEFNNYESNLLTLEELSFASDMFQRPIFLPDFFKKKRFYNAFLTPNPLVLQLKHFSQYFDRFTGFEYNHIHSAKDIFSDIIQIIRTNENYFIFSLIMDCHLPYFDGKETYPKLKGRNLIKWYNIDVEKAKKFQIESVSYIDSIIKPLLTELENVELIITSDHGELFAEEEKINGKECKRYGHSFPPNNLLHKVPFLRVKIK